VIDLEPQQGELVISKRAFLSSFSILAVLMLAAGLLTRIVPAGQYTRTLVDGIEVLDPDSFQYITGEPYPIWRWLTAPIEVLWGPDSLTIIMIVVFLLVIGGSFAVLGEGAVLRGIIARIVSRFGHRKQTLLAVILLFFMSLGSVLGIFEEVIPLVPIMISLAYSLGWDSLTGLGMSLLAAGFGFSAAISNPFSIGISQQIAGLPLFSGALFRAAIFAVVYLVLYTFLARHIRRIERDPSASPVYAADQAARTQPQFVADLTVPEGPQQASAVRWFSGFLLAILVVMISAPVIPGLSDLVLPLIGILFLVGTIVAGRKSGMGWAQIGGTLGRGMKGIALGVPLILMAMSIKQIVAGAGIMDTILHGAADLIAGTSIYGAIFLVYALILGMEVFIGSSSAKAFLIMPIIAPLADLVGLTRQSTVLAFGFGDGFSNVLYPTNPVLLIALGLTVVSFPKWLRWILPLQVVILLVSSLFLALAVAMRLGPF